MKTIVSSIFVASALLIGGPAIAQKVVSTESTAQEVGVDYFAKQSIGTDVLGRNGDKVGVVANMGLTQAGKVEYVIVEPTGQSGNTKSLAIKYDQFKWNAEKQLLTLDMSSEDLMSKL